jgi:hypothetical protein
VFAGYRGMSFDTVLGPVALTRAWYHRAACAHGLAPRDARLGVAGETLSPGLRATIGVGNLGRGPRVGGRTGPLSARATAWLSGRSVRDVVLLDGSALQQRHDLRQQHAGEVRGLPVRVEGVA